MAASCSFNPNIGIFKKLKNLVRKSSTANEIVSLYVVDNKFTDNFTNWLDNKLGKKLNYDLTTKDENLIDTIARGMRDYYYHTHASVENTTLIKKVDDFKSHYGYTSDFARDGGILYVGTELLSIYNDMQDKGVQIKGNKLSYYIMRLKDNWLNLLYKSIADKRNIKINDIRKAYLEADDKVEFLDKQLGKTNKTEEDKNLLAVYQELFASDNLEPNLPDGSNYSVSYIREVLANPSLDSVRADIYNLLEDENDKYENNIADASTSEDESVDGDQNNNDVNEAYQGDYSIMQYNSHGGMYSSFLKHVGSRISNYFNTLKKLSNPDDKTSFVRDNEYGISECMDAVSCTTMMYSTVNCNNVSDMIKDIRSISKRIKGFEAFAQLADDLENNLDFATEFRTVFFKLKIPKIEVIKENGNCIIRVSNNNANTTRVMINQLYADIASTSIGVDYDFIDNQIELINNSINKTSSNEDLNKALDKIIKLIKQFYPSIQKEAVQSFVELNNVNSSNKKYSNIARLIGILRSVSSSAKTTAQGYDTMIYKLNAANTHNNLIRQEERKGDFTRSDEYINTDAIINEGFISDIQKQTINSIVDALLPYSIISVDLNSRNIYGNNTSNIINNSHVGNLYHMMNMFTRENGKLKNDVLLTWAKERVKTGQYKYSNIFLEHRDNFGRIINYGILTSIGNDYVLTDYADKLLYFGLFNGSSDLDNGNNVGYAKMTEGDYLPTSYMLCLNTKAEKWEKGIPFEVGTFFLRTPADAPKNHTVRMPLYDTYDLLRPANGVDLNALRKDIVRQKLNIMDMTNPINIKYMDDKYKNEAILNLMDIEVDQFTGERYINYNKYINPKKDIRVKDIDKFEIIDKKTGEGRIEFFSIDTNDYNSENEKPKNAFVLTGKLTRRGDYYYLTNAKFLSLVGYDYSTNEVFNEVSTGIVTDIYDLNHKYIDNELYYATSQPYIDALRNQSVDINGKHYEQIEMELNAKHPVYNILFNNFKQELIDAGNALNHYFVFNGNEIAIEKIEEDKNKETLTPIFKDKVKGNTTGYNFYHLKDGKLTKIEEGKVKLLGNVFHSSKFKFGFITNDNNGKQKIIDRNYLEELISDEIVDRDKDGKIDKSKINLLYGRKSNTNLKFVFDNNLENRKCIDVEFTHEQESAINEKLKEFILNYVNYVSDNVRLRQDYIVGQQVNNNNITKYAVNQLIAHFIYDELFDGNTKYYKDPRTVLKRTKQNQGSGISYGMADITDYNRNVNKEPAYSYLNNGKVWRNKKDEKGKLIRDAEGNIEKEEISVQDLLAKWKLNVRQRAGFKAITIKNSKNSRNATFQTIIDYLIKNGMSKEHAWDLIYGPIKRDIDGVPLDENDNRIEGKNKNAEPARSGGFTDTKVNDAQSYITIEEWIRRIASRGQLQRYLPLIEKIQNFNPAKKSTYLTAAELTEFVQVQKNFYYDVQYDERYDTFVPRQIKNAEFVLIPQLIEGTQLEKVYKMMKEAGIDQLNTVETSKASNETVLTLWDNDGNISDERYANFVGECKELLNHNITSYWYTNLYTQQETPQHMNAKNKAGIQFVKKIMDNIPEYLTNEKGEVLKDKNGKLIEHHLHALKNEFFKVYSTNIEQSLFKLCKELDIPKDENGNIILDADGKIQGLSAKKLYDKLMEEFMRTGMDQNLVKYCLLDEETGRPLMPSYMNNVLVKFESIVQSIFNHSITRQELPGFHAAQVTNVGFKSIREMGYDAGLQGVVTYDKKLKYHIDENGQYTGHIEVMVPLSFLGIDKKSSHYRNMNNEDILKELQNKGLDEIIGYRIPTEGKQSICNMKVVGLLDDSQGSTIIVPDEWVAQTGSDFDIDSIYAIQYATKISSNGEVNKVEYWNEDKELTKADYITYLRENTRNDELLFTREINKELYNKRKQLIDSLPDSIKSGVVDKLKKYNQQANKQVLEGKDKIDFVLNQFDSHIQTLLDKCAKISNIDESIINTLKDIKQANENIQLFNDNNADKYNDELKQLVESKIDASFEKAEQLAKENTLLSYNDFLKKENRAVVNSKNARDNRILEICRTILNDPAAIEENLSRSNFDDIVRARNNAMSTIEKKYRESYSPYDVIAQIKYQDDAMSGADLKALSVTLDTFCSVCNTVKPVLTTPIKVLYDTTYNISLDNVKKMTDDTKYKKGDNGQFLVIHDKYGWSDNNKNVVGKILTAYSSQTTALILDAIKEGNIPNVNTYSFGAFKTLVNLGIAYEAAIPFIMQPAITQIINNQKKLKSVFGNSYGNPIHLAIKDIARKLNIEDEAEKLELQNTTVDTMTIAEIMSAISSKYKKEFNEIFDYPGKEKDIAFANNLYNTSEIPLLVNKINQRINEEGDFSTENTNRLLFDLGNIILYNSLHNIASDISKMARVSNPDKFGAKQSLYATRKIFNDIDAILYDKELGITEYDLEQLDDKQKNKMLINMDENGNIRFVKKRKKDVLIVPKGEGNVNILAAIYPGCNVAYGDVDDVIKSILSVTDNTQSSYPTLFAFLKSASITSISVAKQVFDTQRPRFVQLCEGLSSVLSDYNKEIDETTYNDFQKYLINYLYTRIGIIKHPVKINIKDKQLSYELDTTVTPYNERRRIFGIGYSPTLYIKKNGKFEPFTVKDINNVTEEELREFEKFTPAQKIQWLKSNLYDAGLFNYIDVKLYNEAVQAGKSRNMQTIEFTEQNANINSVLTKFKQAYYNSNPLIVSAVIDIVKYAVIVEGFNMTKKGVMKVINNDILIQDTEEGGLGFVSSLQNAMNSLNNGKLCGTIENIEVLYENYLRTKPNFKGIKTINVTNYKAKSTGLYTPYRGMYVIQRPSKANTTYENQVLFEKNLTELGIGYKSAFSGTYKSNSYVRLKRNGRTLLYKIVDLQDRLPGTVILYPLGDLQKNEFDSRSVKNANNEDILSKQTYKELIKDYIAARSEANESNVVVSSWINNQINKYIQERKFDDIEFVAPNEEDAEFIPAEDFNLEELSELEGGNWTTILNLTKENFKDLCNVEPVYTSIKSLGKYIHSPQSGSVQEITLDDGRTIKVYIRKVNLNKYKGHRRNSFADFYLTHEQNAKVITNKSLREIVEHTQDRTKSKAPEKRYFEDVYQIGLVDDAQYAATETIFDDTIDFAKSLSRQGDEVSKSFVRSLENNDIKQNEEVIKENLNIVSREATKYVLELRDKLHDMFVKFAPNPELPANYYSITSDEGRALIRNNKQYEDKAFFLVNAVEAFINKFSVYDSIETDDPTMRNRLNKIKEAVKDMREIPIEKINRMIADVMADRTSTNPLIKDGLIDVMDGYWKSYGNMWQFNDVAENGTPILQITLKEIMGNLDAQRMMRFDARRKYWDKIKQIQAEAKKNGKNVDINKIIDKGGRFVQDYSPELQDRYDELLTDLNKAREQYGLGSIQHLKAKLAYDEFKAEYFNQEVEPSYYFKKNSILRQLIEINPRLAEKYYTLYYERAKLYEQARLDGFTEDLNQKISKNRTRLWALTRGETVIDENGNFTMRPILQENEKVYKNGRLDFSILSDNKALYSSEAFAVIYSYLDASAKLEEEYFERDAVFGFEQELNDNLQIVRNAEDRDANGIPRVPLSQLANNKEYQKAKQWLRTNARYKLNAFPLDDDEELPKFFAMLDRAKTKMNLEYNGINSAVSNYLYSDLATKKDIKDENGIIDGNTLTDEERAKIRKLQNAKYKNDAIPETSDRQLLTNVHQSDELYSRAFYNHLKSEGVTNEEYYKLITEANEILTKYYDNVSQRVRLDLIPRTKKGIEEIKRLAAIYQKLRNCRRTIPENKNDKGINPWIKENVEFATEEDAWKQTITNLNQFAKEDKEWYKAIYGTETEPGLLFEHKKDGTGFSYKRVKKGKQVTYELVPNRFLFSYIKPKDKVKDKWLSPLTKEELEVVRKTYKKVPTVHWYKAQAQKEKERQENIKLVGQEEADRIYNEWWEAQHVFNPYTREKELIQCWITTSFNSDVLDNTIIGVMQSGPDAGKIITAGEYIPAYDQTERTPKQDKLNKNYKKDVGVFKNYQKHGITGKSTKYDTNADLNEYEIQLKDYLQGILMESAHNDQGQGFFKRGYAPWMVKEEKLTTTGTIKEASKLLGFNLTGENGKKPWYDTIGFENDKTPIMPMTSKLGNEVSAELNKDLAKHLEDKPRETDFNDDKEYAKKLNEWTAKKKDLENKIQEIHESLLNRDWLKVIDEYLDRVSRFNAIQDNKLKMYWLLNELRKMKMYNKKFGSYGDLKEDTRKSTDTNTVYAQDTDNALIEQYETLLHRLLFDQWKKQEGKLTKFANALQSFTSANYMTFNIRGGIANVTLGLTGMLAESVAKEYFGDTWGSATAEYNRGILSYGRRAWNEDFGESDMCYSKQDAVIQYFKVVDYDEHTGVVKDASLRKVSEGLRNFTYSPQTAGEHFMQNSVLFAMLKSHKLITLPGGEVTYMNKSEYLRYKEGTILNEILTPEQKESFAEFKENIKKDKNQLKDYAWFRKNALTEWIVLHCNKEQKKQFVQLRKEKEKAIKEEFDNLQDLYSQLELGEDGHMAFKAGSQLAKLNEEYKLGTQITKAIDICGNFAERVRKVNNKIHGVYNRDGAANIEKEWYGSLIMQYHKHLPIGLLKRYRARGYYNEFRGSVEKGLLQSMIDFITLNTRNMKADMTEQNENAVKSFQHMALNCFKFFTTFNSTWNILPEYERQNIKRNLGDLTGTLTAFAALVGLWCLAGADKDLEDNTAWNLALYEFDRLATESFMYNPWGLYAEGKKLMSTPISAQSIVGDAMATAGALFEWMLTDDYEYTYQSGRFAGQPKLLVYLQRRIPMYSSIHSIFDLIDSNHYYKIADSYSTIFGNPKKIAGVED